MALQGVFAAVRGVQDEQPLPGAADALASVQRLDGAAWRSGTRESRTTVSLRTARRWPALRPSSKNRAPAAEETSWAMGTSRSRWAAGRDATVVVLVMACGSSPLSAVAGSDGSSVTPLRSTGHGPLGPLTGVVRPQARVREFSGHRVSWGGDGAACLIG